MTSPQDTAIAEQARKMREDARMLRALSNAAMRRKHLTSEERSSVNEVREQARDLCACADRLEPRAAEYRQPVVSS